MYHFKPITIQERDLFNEYLSIHRFPNSEYNFTTIFAWENINRAKYTIYEDCLLIYGVYQEKDFCYFPLGPKEKLPAAFYYVNEIFKSRNKNFIMTSVSKPMLGMMEEFGLDQLFTIKENRDQFDYVYRSEKLADLKGKKLSSRRNHLNYLIKNHEFHFEDLNEDNLEACAELLTKLILERSYNKEDELTATARVLKYRKELKLQSKVLYVDGKIEGLIIGENHFGSGLIQIAKSNVEVRGASVAMFKHFSDEFYRNFEYINLMEDIGLEGLRKVKLSYDPDCFIEKYYLEKNLQIPIK